MENIRKRTVNPIGSQKVRCHIAHHQKFLVISLGTVFLPDGRILDYYKTFPCKKDDRSKIQQANIAFKRMLKDLAREIRKAKE